MNGVVVGAGVVGAAVVGAAVVGAVVVTPGAPDPVSSVVAACAGRITASSAGLAHFSGTAPVLITAPPIRVLRKTLRLACFFSAPVFVVFEVAAALLFD